jgi:opacity protein-like surface antigen
MSKLKGIGLAVLALAALSAVSASAAQAAIHWNVNGAALESGKSETLTETVTLEKFESETTPSLTFTVSGLFRITCTGLKITGGKITGTKTGSAANLKLSSCLVKTNTGGETKCQVKNEGGTVGTIETVAVISELKEVSGKAYDVIAPMSGTTLMTGVIGPQAGFPCALSGIYKVTGNFAEEVPIGTNEKSLAGVSSAAIATAAGTSLNMGTRSVILDYKGRKTLSSGFNWSVTL